ncbi:MAG: 3-dehydroquinate synthase family protein, partial [Oscillospiraceae bacterium]
YNLIIKRGALARAAQLAHLNRRVMVVSDSGVPRKMVDAMLRQCPQGHCFIFPQGEASKTPEVGRALLSQLLQAGFDRHDAIVALGGGVVSDVAGYAAAGYMRGIEWLQFPTTTTAQMDACLGGKVALNLDGVKNIVGTLHHPRLVVADPNALKSLPQRHFTAGLAEALKVALLGDGDLFGLLETGNIAENLERILFLALQYKKNLVEGDVLDQGPRRLLNFGHTIGYGLEAAGRGALLHGECVALGMLPMIESRALLRRTRAVMKKLGLPLKHHMDPDTVLRYIALGKNREDTRYTVARVKALGQGYLETVDFDELALLVKGE